MLILKPEVVRISDTARVDSFTKIEGGRGVVIGEHVHVASFCHINGGGGWVELRDHCGLSSGVRVAGGQPDLGFLHISPAYSDASRIHVIRKATIISSYAIIFSNAVILPGITVGFGAVIGAGAVITKDVPPWAIMMGVPARQVGVRKLWDGEAELVDDQVVSQLHILSAMTHDGKDWLSL